MRLNGGMAQAVHGEVSGDESNLTRFRAVSAAPTGAH